MKPKKSRFSEQQLNMRRFLIDKFEKGESFTKGELEEACGWEKVKTAPDGKQKKNTTFGTYFSKQLKSLLVPVGRGRFRVSEAFRKVASLDEFHKHVTQNKHLVAANYVTDTYDTVLLFEFFMPLANEADLRKSLDSLFYRDSIMTRLAIADRGKLQQMFPKKDNESDPDYLDRACDWASNKFGGYSISHVNGRFRAAPLMTRQEALQAAEDYQRYLVDETTAIVRFIFPCGKAQTDRFDSSATHSEPATEQTLEQVKDEATLVRYFFHLLFVTAIVESVNGQDEIWLLESGMQSKLHVWRVVTDDQESEEDEDEE